MKTFNIILLVGTLALSGCSTTGGTILGLFPAPKFIDGSFENNSYVSKDKSFSISLPHKTDSYEYKYMAMKEQYGEGWAYVSFGPAAFDQSIYRLHLGKKPEFSNIENPMQQVANVEIENNMYQLEVGYKSKPILVEKKLIQLKGQSAYYVKLSQEVPAGVLISNKSAHLLHEMIGMDYGDTVAFVWIQTMSDSHVGGRPIMSVKEFAESLRFRNDS